MSGKASNFIQMKEDPKNLGRGISTDNDPTLNYIEFNYSIHEGVSDATLNELTLTAKSINKNYRLDIKASALQDYNIETWDITIEPNIDIFQDIVSDKCFLPNYGRAKPGWANGICFHNLLLGRISAPPYRKECLSRSPFS